MVAAFSDYVFRNRIGAIGMVETEFGFHVIEVQDKKDVVKLATISKKLIPSESTSNIVFTQATQFELDVQQNDFNDQAALKGYAVKDINDIKELEESLPALGNQRQVVKWAFEEDRQALDVKRFALSTGGYVIVQVSSVKEAGLPDAKELLTTLRPKVLIEKKKAALLKQIEKYSSLEDVAQQFNQTVSSAKAVNRFTSMLAGASQESDVVGTSYELEIDALSDPIGGNSGVFVVQLKSKNAAEELSSYAGYKASISNSVRQNAQLNTAEALKSAFEVTDNRKLYY